MSTLRLITEYPPPIGSLSKVTADYLTKTWHHRNIHSICPTFHSDESHHCAHFVSHVLGINHADVCKGGYCTSVAHIFQKARQIGLMPPGSPCLCFLTIKTNWHNKHGKWIIGDDPHRHVGLFCSGVIWHYCNSRKKVIFQPPDHLITRYDYTKTKGEMRYALI